MIIRVFCRPVVQKHRPCNVDQIYIVSPAICGCFRDYAAITFIANNRFETGKKKLAYLNFRDFVVCATHMITNWSYSSVGKSVSYFLLSPVILYMSMYHYTHLRWFIYLATGAVPRALMESSLGAKIRQFSACSFLLCVLRNDVFSALK